MKILEAILGWGMTYADTMILGLPFFLLAVLIIGVYELSKNRRNSKPSHS